MFYLLKSTFKRENIGDVLIDLDRVESIRIGTKKFDDTENEIFVVKVDVGSGNDWMAIYLTLDEAKKVVKDILGDKIDDKSLGDLISQRNTRL